MEISTSPMKTEINRLFRDCAHGAVPSRRQMLRVWISSSTTAVERPPEILWKLAITRTLLHMGHAQV